MKREILMVDDEPLAREPIAEVLRHSGYHVEETSSGSEALKILKKKEFALVISDVLMPGINGIELIRELHKISPATEAIVCSAYGTEATKDKLDRMGVFGYQDKPVRREPLLEMVAEAVKSNRRTRLGYEDKKPVVSFNRERVLVADDDPAIRDLVSMILSEEGYRVNSVNDGCQAMETILINDYDLIILDINMPNMNGIETVRAIRRHDAYSYILLISGEAEKTEVAQAMECGADRFLPKPFKSVELLAAVGKLDFEKLSDLRSGQAEREKRNVLDTYSWFQRVFNPHALRKLRRGALQLVAPILIGILVGGLAVLFDAGSGGADGSGPITSRFDRLIEAVEGDWGR